MLYLIAILRNLIFVTFFLGLTNQLSVAQVGLAEIHGRVIYNDKPIVMYTKAYAKLMAFYSQDRKKVEVDFQYNNETGEYQIFSVPPGVYGIQIFIDAAPPFGIRSPGDYDDTWSGMNDKIEVAPHNTNISVDLVVKHNIRLLRPIDTMDFVQKPSSEPFTFYGPGFGPSAETFEWAPVPGASYYQVSFTLSEGDFTKPEGVRTVNVINQNIQTEKISPGLKLTKENQRYFIYIRAFNSNDKLIGGLTYITANRWGGGFSFIILPKF